MSLSTSAWIILGAIAALVALATFVLVRGWRGDVTLKAITKNGLVSLAGGLELFGVSASIAAILGGPGVISVQWRSRELYRRSLAHVTFDALLESLDALLDRPKTETSKKRLHERLLDRLLERTDVAELPELALRILLDLRDPELTGKLTCGFQDPVLTGKTAAALYPIAGVLAPLGRIDVSFDWSGKTIVDGNVDFTFRVVLGRVLREALRFARRHVHFKVPASTLPLLT